MLVVGLCAAALSVAALIRARGNTPARLLERLPENSSAIAYIDFGALRQAGVLDMLVGPEVTQEAEYRAFIEATGFDYSHDLDSVLMAFTPRGRYFLVRGRFDWRLLKNYVESQRGRCRNAFCRVQGSTPDRLISFFPVERGVMALAVSPDDSWAATQLQVRRPREMDFPQEPVWAIFSAPDLAESERLPAGSRAFARALEGAGRVVLAAGEANGGIELRLRVSCGSGDQAAALRDRLKETTALLQELMRKEGQAPNPRDLTGVLTNGVFEQQGTLVTGRWPVPKQFLEALAGGGV